MPIEYRALRSLQAALQAIGEPDGYHFSVTDVAVKLDPNTDVEALISPDGPRPFIVLQVSAERRSYDPGAQVKIVLPITVHWVNESVATDDESRMETFYKGCADVEKAIAIDVGRGGTASDTRIVKCVYDDAIDGTLVWAQIEVEIRLHRTYGEPNG